MALHKNLKSIKGDASFRKFFIKKKNNNSSIIFYAKKANDRFYLSIIYN